MLAPAALTLGAFVVYLATAPRLVNGDGIGYLKLATYHTAPPPGHLLYGLLLEALLAASHARSALGLLEPARVLSAAAGAAAVALVVGVARELGHDRRAALMVAAGCAVSWGVWQEADDVETYAVALAALVAAVLLTLRARRSGRARDGVWAGLAAALAVLFHLANLLALPFLVLVLLRRGARPEGSVPSRRPLWAALVTGVVALAAPILIVGVVVLHQSPRGLLAWLTGSNHGFHYPLHLYVPLVAVWGASRTLAFAPFPIDASLAVTVVESTVAVAVLGVTLAAAVRGARDGGLLDGRAALVWALPTAALGVYYYGSDSERWIFLVPLVWLLAVRGRPRLSAVLVAFLCVWNLVVEVVPDAVASKARDQAATASQVVHDGDLVVAPGHGWDEYIGFYQGEDVRVIPLAYFAGSSGSAQGAFAALDYEIDRALGGGHDVYAARVFLTDATDRTDGWKELAAFGIGRSDLQAHLEARYQVSFDDAAAPVMVAIRNRPGPPVSPQ
jgi:hypothetical protein